MLLSISGGGTKIAALLGIAEQLYKKNHINPTVVSGVSSGAILTLPIVLGLWDKMKKHILSGDLNNVFTNNPFKPNGDVKFLAYLKLLFLGNFDRQNIQAFISKIVSEQDFNHYKQNPNLFPKIYIATTNANTQESVVWDLQRDDIFYEKYLNIVAASCAVPIVTPPIIIDGEPHFDGGLRFHNLTSKLLENDLQVAEVISIYARPSVMEKKAIYKHSFKNVIPFTMNTLLCSISENNESYEQIYCKHKEIKLKQLFVEFKTNGFYIFDKKLIDELYSIGYNLDIKI